MAEIKLTSGEAVLLDDADFDVVSPYVWRRVKSSTLYAAARIGEKTVYMHRLLMSPGDEDYVDHVNHNGLDNRRGNLRVVSPRENQMNRRKEDGKTSKYLGVSFVPPPYAVKKPWVSYCRTLDKTHNLGYFATEEEAAAAYDIFKVLVDGEHASTNASHWQFTEIP